MDAADRAQAVQEQEWQHRLQMLKEWGDRQNGAEFCDECGVKIPEKRRQAVPGCRLCVQCQAAREEE